MANERLGFENALQSSADNPSVISQIKSQVICSSALRERVSPYSVFELCDRSPEDVCGGSSSI
jgi:hypothetical protein